MAYVPTPSHGALVGVAKATVHIFSNAMGRVNVTLVRPKEQFHTPHCLTKIKIELKGSNKNAG